jgi:hypothetical protein
MLFLKIKSGLFIIRLFFSNSETGGAELEAEELIRRVEEMEAAAARLRRRSPGPATGAALGCCLIHSDGVAS